MSGILPGPQTFKVHLTRGENGQRTLREGEAPPGPRPLGDVGPVPARVARLVALAHHVDGLVRAGRVRDYAQAAALSGVTRARVTQIVNLLLLAPDIQEHLLSLTRPALGDEPLTEQHLRSIAMVLDWCEQRKRYAALSERIHK